MTPLITTLITVAALCGGGHLGSFLRERLPDQHFHDESREVIKAASGMIATLVALVIGLLVSSAKSSFDQANDGLTQAGAKLILLERTLSHYGQEAMPIRVRMRDSIKGVIERLWPSGSTPKEGMEAVEKNTQFDELQDLIQQLSPKDEMRRSIKAQALQTCNDLGQSRWLMIEKAQTTLPTPFLVMLIFWLTVLFTSLGLLAPRNLTTVACLFVCALSMAGAILLMMEMNRPFDGLIQASPAPLLKAVSVMAH
jgi:hypothetical protein